MLIAAFTSALAEYPQARQEKTAWLSRFSLTVCPHSEQRWLVYAGGTATTATGDVAVVALSVRRRRNSAHACEEIERFRPAFCLTFLPGAVTVPLAERVICFTFRSSMQTTS